MRRVAGYSGTPLLKKLGVKPESTVLLDRAPDGFSLGPELPGGVVLHSRPGRTPYDLVLAFTTARADLARRLPRLVERIPANGTIWVCWPKKAAAKLTGVTTDMTEDVVREVAFPLGLVDVKVAAVDEIWSGLKLVIRLENRR